MSSVNKGGKKSAPELLFDPKKVDVKTGHENYFVTFFVFQQDDEVEVLSGKDLKKYPHKENTQNRSCFASLYTLHNTMLSDDKVVPNRLLFMANLKKYESKKDVDLSEDETAWWINKCKAEKLLPDYTNVESATKGVFCFKYSDISLQRLYMFLTSARHVQETPWFIRAMIHMVEDLGLNFWVAIEAASSLCIPNTGHHFINRSRNYGIQNPNDPKTKFCLSDATKLGCYTRMVDSEKEKIGSAPIKRYGFNFFDTLLEKNDYGQKFAPKLNCNINKEELKKKEIVDLVEDAIKKHETVG